MAKQIKTIEAVKESKNYLAIIKEVDEIEIIAGAKIEDEETNAIAIDALSRIKKQKKLIKDHVKELISDADAWVKSVKKFYKATEDKLGALDTGTRKLMNEYRDALEAEAERIRKKEIEREARKAERYNEKCKEAIKTGAPMPAKKITLPASNTTLDTTVKSENGSASYRKIKKWELVDLRALLEGIIAGTVPEDYVTVNAGMIGKARQAEIPIPGIKYTVENSIAVK